MGRISVFNHVTLDGFFAGPHGEIDWFKFITPDDQWNAYTHSREWQTLVREREHEESEVDGSTALR